MSDEAPSPEHPARVVIACSDPEVLARLARNGAAIVVAESDAARAGEIVSRVSDAGGRVAALIGDPPDVDALEEMIEELLR